MFELAANVDCEPRHSQQFARMAHVLLTSSGEKASPTIGLLNVGSEDTKGNALVKETAMLLREDNAKGLLNFLATLKKRHF